MRKRPSKNQGKLAKEIVISIFNDKRSVETIAKFHRILPKVVTEIKTKKAYVRYTEHLETKKAPKPGTFEIK